MIWHWIGGPHSMWGWVLDVGSLLSMAWILGFWIVCLVAWWQRETRPPYSYTLKRVTQERGKLQEYKAIIDALYDRAEQEVNRLTSSSEPGKSR